MVGQAEVGGWTDVWAGRRMERGSLRKPQLHTHPDGGIHPRGGQPVGAAGRTGLEVQAVHWLLVVPGDFTGDDLHPPV